MLKILLFFSSSDTHVTARVQLRITFFPLVAIT